MKVQRTWGDGLGNAQQHTITAISFSKGTVSCSCGESMVLGPHPSVEVVWDLHTDRAYRPNVGRYAKLASDSEVSEFLAEIQLDPKEQHSKWSNPFYTAPLLKNQGFTPPEKAEDTAADAVQRIAELCVRCTCSRDPYPTLTGKEWQVLSLRHGIGTNRPMTLQEVGNKFNVTRERIRQIEHVAQRKVRHPNATAIRPNCPNYNERDDDED